VEVRYLGPARHTAIRAGVALLMAFRASMLWGLGTLISSFKFIAPISGSISALPAAGTGCAAGVTAGVAVVSFAGTGGLGAPVSIVVGVGSISSLVASGLCLIAGVAMTLIAIDAYNAYMATIQLYGNLY